MKLEMGTGWLPMGSGIMPFHTASECDCRERVPMYFWPSCWTWISIGTASCGTCKRARNKRNESFTESTYKLLRERNLLELQLVHGALGRAEQHRRGQESTLHAGRLGQ